MKFSTGGGQSNDAYDEYVPEGFVTAHKKALVVLAIIVIAGIGFIAFNSYEGAVVQTSVVAGKITNIQRLAPASGAPPPPGGAATTSSGETVVTVSLGSTSFQQILQCTSFSFKLNDTVSVADQSLQGGGHRYLPDIACKGGVSPFRSLHLTQTTSSSKST